MYFRCILESSVETMSHVIIHKDAREFGGRKSHDCGGTLSRTRREAGREEGDEAEEVEVEVEEGIASSIFLWYEMDQNVGGEGSLGPLLVLKPVLYR